MSRRRATRSARAARAVGVDTGGTFTDFVARVGGRLVTLKVPSTPRAPERAVLAGLEALGVTHGDRVAHGSTVATNALLERNGARVAFLTTAGFEDVLEIGRQDRPDLYAAAPRRVAPLVPRERRLGVAERIGPGGETLRALTARDGARLLRRVRASRAEALAIGLLHAWASPRHERALARALRGAGLPMTLSSTLCPEFREFERFATTVTNAYLLPRVAGYLERLGRATPARLEIVLSHGGTAPPAEAAREPVRQLLSGPAAGLRAARDAALGCGFARALTLDVGGTSTDVAYVERDLPRRRAREVAGFPVLLPVLDVHTVGAGGGSIARIDPGGMLRVGPESAGADPGPACYGHGGPATVTDALVVLGRLPGRTLEGSGLDLDRAAAERALAALARELGVRGAVAAAEGVVAVAEAHMEAALRRVSVERGHDPRGAALVAFGGAGGLHACALAAALRAEAVVFPTHAGVLSALGALSGGTRRERSRSLLVDAREVERIDRALAALETSARAAFAPGERGRLEIERWCEMRYFGQSHELSIPAGEDRVARFHAAHEARFGFSDSTASVEVVSVDVRAALPTPSAAFHRPRPAPGPRVPHETARVRDGGRWHGARVVPRGTLAGGARIAGPAVVTDSGATFWLPSGWSARVHASGALVARPGRRP